MERSLSVTGCGRPSLKDDISDDECVSTYLFYVFCVL